MRLRNFYSALALSAAVLTGPLYAVAPAMAAGTISGGFDVGPGGFQEISIHWPRRAASHGSSPISNRW